MTYYGLGLCVVNAFSSLFIFSVADFMAYNCFIGLVVMRMSVDMRFFRRVTMSVCVAFGLVAMLMNVTVFTMSHIDV
jgi:hypothetical protein